MDYRLKVLSIYELGQRKNQEDYIYPPIGEVTDGNRLFIVCDGMGGHENGEVASKTVCEKMSEYIDRNYNSEDPFTEDIFNAALAYAYDALDALDNGAEKKMGTTLTFLMFHNDGCFMAHIGDSRIYHIRPSESGTARIRYVTRDHSLVNDLVAIGEMTPEEAKTSRQKNIITRAIQPNQERRSRADIYDMEDVRAGDYFYMCSDGMLEQAEDEEIANVISLANKTDEEKVEMFKVLTKDNKDNHSAHLIKVLSTGSADSVVLEVEVQERNYVKVLGIFTAVLAVLFCLYFCFRDEIKEILPDKPVKELKKEESAPAVSAPEKVKQPIPEASVSDEQTPGIQIPDPENPTATETSGLEEQTQRPQEISEDSQASTLNKLNKINKDEKMREDFVEQTRGEN